MPTSRSKAWAIVIVVLAMITEARPSCKDT
jgi:hypothetical protein